MYTQPPHAVGLGNSLRHFGSAVSHLSTPHVQFWHLRPYFGYKNGQEVEDDNCLQSCVNCF